MFHVSSTSNIQIYDQCTHNRFICKEHNFLFLHRNQFFKIILSVERLLQIENYSKLEKNDLTKGMMEMEKQTISFAQQFNEERFTKIDMIKRRKSSAFLLNFLPDQHMRPHNHPNRELYLHVIEGNGTLLIDGEELAVKEGDVFYCDPEEQIGFTNTSESNVSIFATMTLMSE